MHTGLLQKPSPSPGLSSGFTKVEFAKSFSVRPAQELRNRHELCPLLPLLTIYLTWTFVDACRDFSLFCCPMKHHEAVLMDK